MLLLGQGVLLAPLVPSFPIGQRGFPMLLSQPILFLQFAVPGLDGLLALPQFLLPLRKRRCAVHRVEERLLNGGGLFMMAAMASKHEE